MSLKKEFEKCAKIDGRLQMQIARLDEATSPDAPLFSVFVQTKDSAPLSVPGVALKDTAGTIRTAHNASLHGFKGLVDEPRVTSVSGSVRLRPL